MATFSFNPPFSAVASRVEKATSRLLNTPDWALNMDICDMANSDLGQAKDVVKTIKKRLQHKNPRVQFFTLTLLEMLIKNCGDYVHSQVVERDILQDIVKIVKKGEDMQVKDKALVLLDSWHEAFGGPGGKYPQYYWAYADLRRSGVVFPRRATDAPIFTPARHTVLASGYSSMHDEAMASERGNFSLSEFDKIRNVIKVLDDMLQAVDPYDPKAVKDEVITELVSQCRTNQKKLVEQLSTTGDERVLGQGLELNDSLQNVLAKHDSIASGTPLPSLLAKHNVVASKVPPPNEAPRSPMKQKAPAIQPVIENQFFEDDDDDNDEFAQLAKRKSKFNELSPNHSDVTTASSSDASSTMSNALVLLDPPTPVRTRKDEQNMVDLLTLALTTDSTSAHTPQSSDRSESPSFGQGYGQSYPVNQDYTPYDNYVAPWAQPSLPQPQPLVQPAPSQYTYNYPVLPSTVPYGNINSLQNSYQYPTYANSNPANYMSGYSPRSTQPHYSSYGPGLGNIHQPVNAPSGSSVSGSSGVSGVSANAPNYAPKPLQSYNSIGSRASNVPSTAYTSNQPISDASSLQKYSAINVRGNGEMQMNGNASQAAKATQQKPYYHPDSLFADLIDLSSVGGQKRSGLAGMSSQSVITGRK